jgi:hypothetical protein
MVRFSKPKGRIVENGITYLVRTPEQVEDDLRKICAKNPKSGKTATFRGYWKKILTAKVPICPICGETGGPIRRNAEGTVLGCDKCVHIGGYLKG